MLLFLFSAVNKNPLEHHNQKYIYMSLMLINLNFKMNQNWIKNTLPNTSNLKFGTFIFNYAFEDLLHGILVLLTVIWITTQQQTDWIHKPCSLSFQITFKNCPFSFSFFFKKGSEIWRKIKFQSITIFVFVTVIKSTFNCFSKGMLISPTQALFKIQNVDLTCLFSLNSLWLCKCLDVCIYMYNIFYSVKWMHIWRTFHAKIMCMTEVLKMNTHVWVFNSVGALELEKWLIFMNHFWSTQL